MTTPIIKERKAKTLRSRDGLIQYARNDYSQGGEDGILEKIFTILDEDERNNNNNSNNTIQRWCVDVGAWDGKHLSNTYMLLNSTTLKSKWSGVLIEADVDRCKSLKKLYENKTNNIILNYTVSCEKNSDSSLVNIIKSTKGRSMSYFIAMWLYIYNIVWHSRIKLNDNQFWPNIAILKHIY